MGFVEFLFWFLLFLVFYSYLGYGIVLYAMVRFKRAVVHKKENVQAVEDPEVTLFVTAFNEIDYVKMKVENSFSLDYPKEKVKYIWVTDGSNDGTPEYLESLYPEIRVYHLDERNGKIAAMNRGMGFVETPIVIFSDANTILGSQSIREIVNLFQDPKVGCVSGEKRIAQNETEAAAGAGEGLYWKYESLLKKWDAELYSAVGAAGELFAVRTDLFEEVEKDTLLDDFIISLRIAMKGYTIQYNPNAYSIESASANVKEELKRKIRISAGGLQSIYRLRALLNPFKYGILSFQYISHRVLRWTVAPAALPLLLILSGALTVNTIEGGSLVYPILFFAQVLFYFAALLGFAFENMQIRVKMLFIPYYFAMMNYSVYRGLERLLKKNQSVKWERAKRSSNEAMEEEAK